MYTKSQQKYIDKALDIIAQQWTIAENVPAMTAPQKSVDYLRLYLANENKRECFVVLFLNSQHQLLAAETLFTGTIDGAAIRKIVRSTALGQTNMMEGGSEIVDSIIESVALYDACRIENSCVLQTKGTEHIVSGKNCISAPAGLLDPANLDCRLLPTSPCIGKASDGGDIGCRYTPDVMEMCQLALTLRAQGVIAF